MHFREDCKRPLTSAEKAVRSVQRGDQVVMPIVGPRVLPSAIARLNREGS